MIVNLIYQKQAKEHNRKIQDFKNHTDMKICINVL